jgi:hypothetical protein
MATSSKKAPGSPNTNSNPAVQFLRRYSTHGLEVLELDMRLRIVVGASLNRTARKFRRPGSADAQTLNSSLLRPAVR